MPYTASLSLPFASGSDTSRDAAVKAESFALTQEQEVFIYISACGSDGATQKEIARALGLGRPSVCARCRALEQRAWIRKTAARREGCVAYQAVEA